MRKNIRFALYIAIIIITLVSLLVMLKLKSVRTNNREDNSLKELLEMKYEKQGRYDVGYVEYESSHNKVKKYSIWYPKKLEINRERYPVIIIANGTGATAESHQDVFRHLALWGFVVVGNDDKNSWTGESTMLSLAYILDLNDKEDSIFYHKIDTEKIGVSGHSQGGVGAVNAATNYENSSYFQSIYTISCACIELSNVLGWDYDTTKINIPYFMIAGTGNIDSGLITPLDTMEKAYHDLNNGRLTVMGRRKNVDHREAQKEAKGYMVAWFLTTLKGDKTASKVFQGNHAELFTNTENWQDVKMKNN